MNWQLIVDFDGTISIDDTTDRLLETFAGPNWQDIEQDWIQGKIGSRECMSRQVDLIRATPCELAAFVDGIAIDPDFKSFVRLARRHDLDLTIVSDGIDLIIEAVLRRAGLSGLRLRANHMEHVGGDRWRLSSPHTSDACHARSGTCKCAIAAQRQGRFTLVIGDGRSDRCVASEADFVFAKSGLIAFCEEKRLPHLAITNFSDAAKHLAAMLEPAAAFAAIDVRRGETVYG